jgi:cytoskeletal protein CcmA (bactofilin family)
MRKLIKLGITFILLLSTCNPVFAAPWELRGGADQIDSHQTIQGDLYFSGDILEVDGEIKGDLIVFASRVIINGKVDGSVLGVVTEKITVRGEVGGNLRVMAAQVQLGGKVGQSVSALAIQFLMKKGSTVRTGVLGNFNVVQLGGEVHGPVNITVHSGVKIGGKITGNLITKGARLEWLPPVEIGGRVDDYSGLSAQPGAKQRVKIAGGYRLHPLKNGPLFNYKYIFFFSVIWFMGGILMSLVFFRIFPRTAWKITRPTPGNLQRSLVVGLISFIIIPILVVILMITTVGIPIAIVLTLLYIVLLTFAGVPFTILIGRMVFRKLDGEYPKHPYLLILGGSLLTGVISVIPVIGFFVPIWFGFGMLLGNIKPQFMEETGENFRE